MSLPDSFVMYPESHFFGDARGASLYVPTRDALTRTQWPKLVFSSRYKDAMYPVQRGYVPEGGIKKKDAIIGRDLEETLVSEDEWEFLDFSGRAR